MLNSMHMRGRVCEAIRRRFDYSNIYYHTGTNTIYIVWYNQGGRRWIPYGGGPLYGEYAKDVVKWLANHIETYRDLLPKTAREAKIVTGECMSSNGQIFPTVV